MKKIRSFSLIAAGISLIAGLCVVTAQSSGDFLERKVAKGESLSLICLMVYKHFDSALSETIKTDNPEIKNINLIYPGQVIKLRRADAPAQIARTTTPAATAAKQSPAPAPASNPTQRAQTVMASTGLVTWVEGSVFVTHAGTKSPLTLNSFVSPGDIISSGPASRAEIIFNGQVALRLKENSRITVTTFADSSREATPASIGCSVGHVWAKVRKFRDQVTRFELTLPTAVAGVHGTVYETGVAADSSSQVKVFDGEVAVTQANNGVMPTGPITEVSGPSEVEGPSEVSEEAWTAIVRSMQQISINKNGKPGAVRAFKDNGSDSWEAWNKQRDQAIGVIFDEAQ